jgi:ribosomal protein L37AE/L43A
MDRDQCAVPASGVWDCPTCEQEQRDEYFRNYTPLREQLKAAKADLRTKERHAHHR